MSSGRVAHKVALITGAGSGIGRATAVLLAQEGATVLVADVDRDAAQSVVAGITTTAGQAVAVEFNVIDESAWQSVMSTVLANHQRLDVLVNNAGVSMAKPVAESTLDDWRKVMSVNLDGVFLGTKYAITAMKHGGSIVNIASVSGIQPAPGAAAYCASKAALRMFSKTAAIECADAHTGIRINVVTPGGVKTPMWEKEDFFQALVDQHGGTEQAFATMAGDMPSHQFFSADEVAQTILYLASDESAHLTGAEIVLDRGHTV